jgi:DtxR family manganese transport transcriptional regulator
MTQNHKFGFKPRSRLEAVAQHAHQQEGNCDHQPQLCYDSSTAATPPDGVFGSDTRSAQSSALLEDYVELIADLLAATGEARPTDIARRLGVSHATVIKTISRLKREGFATARPYRGVFLTDSGKELAVRVRARHRLVVDVLLALGVPREAAEADAEGIEHHVSETALRAFGRFLQLQAPQSSKQSRV